MVPNRDRYPSTFFEKGETLSLGVNNTQQMQAVTGSQRAAAPGKLTHLTTANKTRYKGQPSEEYLF